MQRYLTAARLLADPYHRYRQLREADPIHWDASARTWTMTRHEDVLAGLRHPLLSSHRPATTRSDNRYGPTNAASSVEEKIASWLIRLDPPFHTRLRTQLNRAVAACMTDRRRREIEKTADHLLAMVVPNGGMETVRDFTAPLSATVIMDVIGVAATDQEQFRRYSESIGAFASQGGSGRLDRRAHIALMATESYLRELIVERRTRPREDLVSGLLEGRAGSAALTDTEVVGICALLLLAGHEPTTYALAHAVHNLARASIPLALFHASDPLHNAVEECLRYESPIQGVLRVATGAVELGEATIHPGDQVLVCLGAANRDPSRFPDPDAFDVRRQPNRHLGFGAGPHQCPGAPLARMMLSVALSTLACRVPHLRLASELTEWRGNALFRYLGSLPVNF
jgi:cytochrome P450